MKKTSIIICVIILVLAVAGSVWWRTRTQMQASNSSYTGPVDTIRLAISSAGVDLSSLIWIADNQGYFKNEGLNIQISLETNGVIAQEKVASGSADIATDSDFGFVEDSFKLNNLKILASIDQAQVIDVVARKDRGISVPTDLKGKKIALPVMLAPQFFLGEFLVANGISSSQVTLINTPVADLQQAITSGKVDAIVINDPVAYDTKTTLGANGIDWPAQDVQPFYWLLISNDQFLKNHSDAAKRFLASLLMAENFAKANLVKSKQIMESKFKLDQKYFDQNWPKHKFSLALAQSSLDMMENEARWAIANGATNKTVVPDYLNFIYFDGLAQVKPEAITIIH